MSALDRRSLDPDTIYTLVADSQRRHLLDALQQVRSATVAECARMIAARDRNAPLLEEDARDRIQLSLVHNHLPRLADYDVVEYNAERGEVQVGDAFEELVTADVPDRQGGRFAVSND